MRSLTAARTFCSALRMARRTPQHGTDMILVLGAQSDAGAIVEPQPCSLGLFLRYFQPLAPPDPLHPLVVHEPALHAQ